MFVMFSVMLMTDHKALSNYPSIKLELTDNKLSLEIAPNFSYKQSSRAINYVGGA